MERRWLNAEGTTSFAASDSEQRLRALILYVANKCADDPCFGAVMVNKILFFSDFLTYAVHGKPITGVEYQALRKGPAPVRLLPIRAKMIADEVIDLVDVPFQTGTQKRIIAQAEPDPGLLKERDLRIVDYVISVLSGRRADEVSELSHGWAWKCAEVGDRIPYELIFVSHAEPTQADLVWAAKALAARGDRNAA